MQLEALPADIAHVANSFFAAISNDMSAFEKSPKVPIFQIVLNLRELVLAPQDRSDLNLTLGLQVKAWITVSLILNREPLGTSNDGNLVDVAFSTLQPRLD